MSPKEKALELCQKFGWLGTKWEQTNFYSLDLKNAKQCALIAIDEMLDVVEEAMLFKQTKRDFYKEVKQEIEKL